MDHKISLIITTFNEAKSIKVWCESVLNQTKLPDEVIVVDSNSEDATVKIIQSMFKQAQFELVIKSEKCNISKGRNIAISSASNDLVAITDGGVYLNSDWLELIYLGLLDNNVVAGYYDFSGALAIQKVYRELYYIEPLNVNPETFLPSSRSLGLKKIVWEKIGGYNEAYTIGEDTDFDLKILKCGFSIKFIPEAIVSWDTRSSLIELITQQFKYSFWDGIIKQNIKGHTFLALYSFLAFLSFYCLIFTSYNTIALITSIFIIFSPIILKFYKRSLNLSNLFCKSVVISSCLLSKGAGFISGYIVGTLKK
ncbi:glycosyltransferase [Shewanella frigidimarina]|uniref:glycosyltransferase n=1 Tax=Shewanella frigidimarina TaxID=56812 RepID=UPI003D7AF5DB